MNVMKLTGLGLVFSIVFVASHVSAKDNHYARGIVIQALEPNKLGVGGAKFRTKPNIKGDGVFVYHPKTRFRGVERYLIWLVIDAEAYPLNGPSKMLTPGLKWPREAEQITWTKTGLSPFMASEAIEIVFGRR